MEKVEKVVSNLVLFLLSLLTLLLLFEDYVQVPVWLQPFGRMHPLMLHFPIVLVVALVLLQLFKKHLDPSSFEKINKFSLYLAAITTSLTTLMGFLLSHEESTISDLMQLHKWFGVLINYLIYFLILVYNRRVFYKILLYTGLIVLIFTGHFGAGLTHGTGFLTEPIMKNRKSEITEESALFEGFVQPILLSKCEGCHNEQKKKGGLNMSSWPEILKGGENGPIWIAGDPDSSEMIRRSLLPMEHDDHMPPEGKPQLTASELRLLKNWIRAGAGEHMSLADLSPNDSLYQLVTDRLASLQKQDDLPKYDFKHADEELVASLNNPYRTIKQESPGSPALDVNIYVRQAFKLEYLTELKKIREQIVFLNLAYMPIIDENIEVISSFPNLQKLNLNHTDITGKTLNLLSSCEKLKSLAISGTDVDIEILEALKSFSAIEEIFVWNTVLTSDEFDQMRDALPGVSIYQGYSADSESPLQLSPPVLKNKKQMISNDEDVVLQHNLSNVTIRYTLDGSEPDSVTSQIFEKPFQLESYVTVKAKSYKENWLASEVASYVLFTKGFQPLKSHLIETPNEKYRGNGAESLIDKEKGDINKFIEKHWLGYKDSPFSALVDFGENPPNVDEIVLSCGKRMSSYIMLPTRIEVWGGEKKEELKLLKQIVPNQPTTYEPNSEEALSISIAQSNFRYYKIVAHPMKRLPDWHSGKGDLGWVFVDELFFY
ncbi:c-type cytochrome domain-containing protein [Fulvivirgaceae bacterium BMA10]|uniref:C-type cytochrome domain-containing protein n=1 Tax=Splendidivirga corallicola TaxID=3051826 RepID=A0ABT8KMN8_9BACT|nr:c-type cytochrome domain-containing protein [Fulvivirgaceae bacterium BMA10]